MRGRTSSTSVRHGRSSRRTSTPRSRTVPNHEVLRPAGECGKRMRAMRHAPTDPWRSHTDDVADWNGVASGTGWRGRSFANPTKHASDFNCTCHLCLREMAIELRRSPFVAPRPSCWTLVRAQERMEGDEAHRSGGKLRTWLASAHTSTKSHGKRHEACDEGRRTYSSLQCVPRFTSNRRSSGSSSRPPTSPGRSAVHRKARLPQEPARKELRSALVGSAPSTMAVAAPRATHPSPPSSIPAEDPTVRRGEPRRGSASVGRESRPTLVDVFDDAGRLYARLPIERNRLGRRNRTHPVDGNALSTRASRRKGGRSIEVKRRQERSRFQDRPPRHEGATSWEGRWQHGTSVRGKR